MRTLILADFDGAAEAGRFRALLAAVRAVDKAPVVVCRASDREAMKRLAPRGTGVDLTPCRFRQAGSAMAMLAASARLDDSKAVLVVDRGASPAIGGVEAFARAVGRGLRDGAPSMWWGGAGLHAFMTWAMAKQAAYELVILGARDEHGGYPLAWIHANLDGAVEYSGTEKGPTTRKG